MTWASSRDGRLVLHFLPKYALATNPIERAQPPD
jgi:hypothetical protein